MSNAFLDQPILNGPYDLPGRHWQLDSSRQSTQKIIDDRRAVSLVTPIPAGADDHQDEVDDLKVNGVDVFEPSTGEVRSDNASGIARWFIDTEYNGESFFVRHAYFLGPNDPYKSLKTTLKAEIDPDAWATLNSDTSRPFPRPISNRIAVKVINHLGDEVMKVFKV